MRSKTFKNVDLFLKVGRLKDFYYIYAVNYVFEYIPIIDNYILLIINDMNYDTEGTFELLKEFNFPLIEKKTKDING